jgi:hypothetical protein
VIGVNDAPTITLPVGRKYYLFPQQSLQDLLASDVDSEAGIIDCWMNTTRTPFTIAKAQPVTIMSQTSTSIWMRGTDYMPWLAKI